jgi:hypothetical protein
MALRVDSAAFALRQAEPSARSPMPAKRATGTPGPSGAAANSSNDAAFGVTIKTKPTTISSHAAALTSVFLGHYFSSLWLSGVLTGIVRVARKSNASNRREYVKLSTEYVMQLEV